jgi:hypothetical protein
MKAKTEKLQTLAAITVVTAFTRVTVYPPGARIAGNSSGEDIWRAVVEPDQKRQSELGHPIAAQAYFGKLYVYAETERQLIERLKERGFTIVCAIAAESESKRRAA